MAAQEIGSLFVALGLDSAAFTSGIKRVQGMTGRLQKGLTGVADRAEALGTRLSVASAAMTAFGLAAGGLVKQTAAVAAEIAQQSAISNASTDEFQRMAAGAKTVGIEQGKLADIFKDMNDRIGDFNATGGGPMADFFENIAPKVGITADAFRDLSGPQALQLYVDSLEKAGLNQQEMTFYLEAIASDATALIPLLRNGGAEMARLGDEAQATGAVMSAGLIAKSAEFNDKMRTLGGALEGVRNRLAEALLPVINSFMDVLIAKGVPALDSMVAGLENLIEWFGGLSQPVQEAALVIGAALGAGGPILLAVSVLSRGFAGLLGTGPIGLFIGAAALAVAAWQVWGDDIKAIVGGAIDFVVGKFDAMIASIKGAIEWATSLGDKLREALGLGEKIADRPGLETTQSAGPSYRTGLDTADGLVSGFGDGMGANEADIRSYLQNSLIKPTEDELGIQSPSRVFMAIGNFISQGLGLGIQQGLPGVQASMQGVADAVGTDGLTEGLFTFRDAARDVFSQVALQGKSLGDVLRSKLAGWASGTASKLFDSGFSALWGGLGLPSFANGTNNFAGGLARVNERGGEIMNLPSGTQIIPHDISKRMADRSGGAQTVIRLDLSADLEARILQQAGAQSVQLVQAADRRLPDRIAQINNNPRRR